MFIIELNSEFLLLKKNRVEWGKTQWHNFKLLKRDLSMFTKILKFILGISQFDWEDWNMLNFLRFTDSTNKLFLEPLNGNEVILISLRNLNHVVSSRIMLKAQYFWIVFTYWTPALKVSNFLILALHTDYKTQNPAHDSHCFSTLLTFPLVLILPEEFCCIILFMKESK